MYHRIPVNPPTSFTPGVRRSKRTRVETLEPGERLEYKCHWGNTPTNRLGMYCSHGYICSHGDYNYYNRL